MRWYKPYVPTPTLFLSLNESMYLDVRTTTSLQLSDFLIYFQTVRENFREQFQVVGVPGSKIRSVSVAGFYENLYYPLYLDVSQDLQIAEGAVLMVSFAVFDLVDERTDFKNILGQSVAMCYDYLELYTLITGDPITKVQLWRKCGARHQCFAV
jgi:hypothetical protein